MSIHESSHERSHLKYYAELIGGAGEDWADAANVCATIVAAMMAQMCSRTRTRDWMGDLQITYGCQRATGAFPNGGCSANNHTWLYQVPDP